MLEGTSVLDDYRNAGQENKEKHASRVAVGMLVTSLDE